LKIRKYLCKQELKACINSFSHLIPVSEISFALEANDEIYPDEVEFDTNEDAVELIASDNGISLNDNFTDDIYLDGIADVDDENNGDDYLSDDNDIDDDSFADDINLSDDIDDNIDDNNLCYDDDDDDDLNNNCDEKATI